ncbi:MAG: tyrosine-type recombinase/integrase [Methanothrix sp.]
MISAKTEPEKVHQIYEVEKFFLLSRSVQGVRPRTIDFYRYHLDRLRLWLFNREVKNIENVTALNLTEYLAEAMFRFDGKPRNAGGQSIIYRPIKTFWTWVSVEYEIDNPMARIQQNAPHSNPLPGVALVDVSAMRKSCEERTFYGARDRAILSVLIDTGLRRDEFLALNISDLDLDIGRIHVADGKGGYARDVYIHSLATSDIMRYLRKHTSLANDAPLWISKNGKRLLPAGLRAVMIRRAHGAKLKRVPGIHDFRRAFCVACLRNGMPIVELRRITGHKSTAVLERYLALTDIDIQKAHAKYSPADRL